MPVSISLSSPRLPERPFERGAVVGGEAEPEALGRGGIDAAALEIVAGLGAGEAVELLGIPARDFGHDVGQARRALGLFLGARVGRGDIHPGLAGKLLDRVHERHSAIVGEEADRVAVGAAAEAMVEALVVVDGEARRLLVVERAARLPLAPGADQLHRRRDDRAKAWSERAIRRARRGEGHDSTLCANRCPASRKSALIHRSAAPICRANN